METQNRVVVYGTNYLLDKSQQINALKAFAKRRGLVIIDQFWEEQFCYKIQDRQQLPSLLKQLPTASFDTILVYKFSSIAYSLEHFGDLLQKFHAAKLRFISVEDNLELDQSNYPDAFKAIETVIQVRHAIKSEQTQLALAKAKEKGKKLGRPTKASPTPQVISMIQELARSTSLSIKRIRIETGMKTSYSNTSKIVKQIRSEIDPHALT